MRKVLTAICFFIASYANAQIATHAVISEVYGGGGNAGATYTNDFIELYNPTASAISLSGWSVQYASAAGNFTQVTNLSGSIPARSFYLVQEAAGASTTTSPLPTPDATGSIAMSSSTGKVALVNTTTALGASCTGSQVIDLVAYGSGVSCSEGSSPAATLSNTTSAERKASATSTATTLGTGGSEVSAGNGYDSNVNGSDFVAQTVVNPQNTSVTEGPASNTVSVAAGITAAEPATDGTFTITLGTAAPTGGVTVTYSLGGTATGGGTDYTDLQSGTITIAAGFTTGTVTMDVVDDLLAESNETIVLTLLTASASYTLASSSTATISITDNDAITLISAIQGSGTAATAGTYTAEAIVTGVYPSLSPAGFYMQEENTDADASAATSEGIFVVSSATVAVGDKVRVTGTVQENLSTPSFGQAVFTSAAVTIINSSNTLPTATVITLPVTAVSDFEKYEGMRVRFPDTLTVTNNYDLGRYGELGLSAGGVVYQPTQIIDPNDNPAGGTTSAGASNVPAINALVTANALRTILLDDGYNTTTTLPYADPVDSTLRIGSTIVNLTGILGFAFSEYRVQPVPGAAPAFSYAPRPAVPNVGSANVKVASFNVLNYFNGNGSGGGFPTTRGANSLAEFNRQRAKIISAITLMNADVVGLTEIENDGVGSASAIQDLVNGLNAVLGSGTYSIINDGASIQTYGTDEIRCGIIYKSSVVTPTGAVMLSPSATFNRPPVAQTFTLIATGVKFNFIINHFKSKGCTASSGADLDQGDGQSCYNNRRRAQSAELLNFIDTAVIPNSGTSRIISVGDYNSYEEEDPLDSLRAANYTVLGNGTIYSYQFSGQIGSLDHAIVSSSLYPYITGFGKWNINAAEPVYLDYNDVINDGGSDFANPFGSTYTTGPYRSSDHDPVLIGLNLPNPLPVVLTDFNAIRHDRTVSLSWTTAQEINSREFIVERSANGAGWVLIARVAAGGKKSSVTDYTATDVSPLTGANLYRLKSVDLDGSFTYSAIRKVNFEHTLNATVYPNPATGILYIDLSHSYAAGNSSVQILNMVNQTMLSGQITDSEPLQLDISSLAAGVYFVRIVASEGIVDRIRFIKK